MSGRRSVRMAVTSVSLPLLVAPTMAACFYDFNRSAPDAGLGADGAIPACADTSRTAGTPPFVPPRPIHQNACNAAQIGIAAECAVRGASSKVTSCAAFRSGPENAACAKCLYSQPSDSAYGAIIGVDDGEGDPNIAGCVAALSGDSSGTSCGAAVYTAFVCRSIMCARCARGEPFATCVDQLQLAGVCTSITNGCDEPYRAQCFPTMEGIALVTQIARVFCMP